jgi:hypothetical protein
MGLGPLHIMAQLSDPEEIVAPIDRPEKDCIRDVNDGSEVSKKSR